MTEYENNEKELWGVVYSAIPYNVEDIVLPDYVREEIANQIMPELNKLILADVAGHGEHIKCECGYDEQMEQNQLHDAVRCPNCQSVYANI